MSTQAAQHEGATHQTSFDDLLNRKQLEAELRDRELMAPNGLEWSLRNRERNGLSESGAVLLVNGRFVFHRSLFLNWLLSQRA